MALIELAIICPIGRGFYLRKRRYANAAATL